MKFLKHLLIATSVLFFFAIPACSSILPDRYNAPRTETLRESNAGNQRGYARNTNQRSGPAQTHIDDEDFSLNLYSPMVYDSLLANWYEKNVAASHDLFFDKLVDIDPYQTLVGDAPDSVYRSRMRMLVSPISLGYNDVIKGYIISYTTKNKALIGRILGLSQVYFPMIEEELNRNGLPIELRMLPVIESALNPMAVSRAGATGLWQFMYSTGKSYGLEVTSFVDDRRDPVKSTQAACKYLGDLYRMYDDWTLAIAAYNCGPGNVNKALKRAGDNAKTFWDIYPYLPQETRGYIPAFVGATYAYTYHKQHGINLVYPPMPISTDTVSISRLTHFGQISSELNMPIEILRTLNPQYKDDIIPAVEKTYPLRLPQYDVTRYLAAEQNIMAKDTLYLAKYINQPAEKVTKQIVAAAKVPKVTKYKVKNGDVLSKIADKHHVTVKELMKWNNIKSADKLKLGQIIEIRK